MNDRGAVEQLPLDGEWQAHDRDAAVHGRALLDHLRERFLRGALERLQVEEVVARVAGQPALGEDEEVDALPFGTGHERERAVGVERAVGDAAAILCCA